MKKQIVSLLLALFCAAAFAQKSTPLELTKKFQPLLDKEFSNFEKFVGVPHSSVKLEGYPKSDDVHNGTPLGLNNDVKNVMTISEENGELILNVTGEIYVGLTTLNEYGNYHLKAQFKWGEKQWAPRLNQKRDNGILYHCKGEHGAFWNVWMEGLEFQVQETDMGDFVALLGINADIKAKKTKDKFYQVMPDAPWITYGKGKSAGYIHINQSAEKPHGEWNTLELITIGDQSMHVVNGKVVMVVKNAKSVKGDEKTPLRNGKIQFQSEGAECYYKNIEIKSVNDFPKKYKKQANL